MTKPSNTSLVVKYFEPAYAAAVRSQLMQVTIKDRRGKTVTLPDDRDVVEFINCSYLGLDLHPEVVAGAQRVIGEWGVHFCCARSRFSIEPQRQLEAGLSELFRGRAITFPSVSNAHLSVLPLIASGVLLKPGKLRKVRLIFDRFAHASMQFLKPILATNARIETIGHNDLDELRDQVRDAYAHGERAVYLADGVYSMGGLCPVKEVLAMAHELDFQLYLDDAHGTSIFGERGEGFVVCQLDGELPDNLIVNFSLAKGFGCNGGGVVVPTHWQESLVRSFGQTYVFSGPLDFSIVGAALVALQLHRNGTTGVLQKELRERVSLFTGASVDDRSFSPIQMVAVGDASRAITYGERLIDRGYFVSVTFFPIVPINGSQLRICLTAGHTREQVLGLKQALEDIKNID